MDLIWVDKHLQVLSNKAPPFVLLRHFFYQLRIPWILTWCHIPQDTWQVRIVTLPGVLHQASLLITGRHMCRQGELTFNLLLGGGLCLNWLKATTWALRRPIYFSGLVLSWHENVGNVGNDNDDHQIYKCRINARGGAGMIHVTMNLYKRHWEYSKHPWVFSVVSLPFRFTEWHFIS